MNPTVKSPVPLWRMLRSSPRVTDGGRVVERLADLDGVLPERIGDRQLRSLLAALADHSPYLWQIATNDTDAFVRMLEADPQCYLETMLEELRRSSDAHEADLMRRLRRTKRSVSLVTALADLGHVWDAEHLLNMLSHAADAYLTAALAFLLRTAQAAGQLRVDPVHPEAGCGLVVIGLGKLGGHELNYSSDVDLVVLFDPRSPALVAPDGAKTFFVRMVRDLVRILQQPTADGYVLRVDLRLRPEPGASAVAISTDAALLYYEQFGQCWERAALIKSRPVAGDRLVGAAFLSEIAPFIWRRYLDFAALSEIHAMKRRIHAAKGWSEIAVCGHNVKLGRGGIRDIEFFIQAQQLIYGGRQPELRGAQTLAVLQRLRHQKLISQAACDDLSRAYLFLRRVENRLQMIGDAQTHVLPVSPDGLERFARFCGYRTAKRFANAFRRRLMRVAHHYALLFEHSNNSEDTDLRFALGGDEVDPDALRRFGDLGFRSPDDVVAAVREWQAGLRPALRSARARAALADLTPKLLTALSQTSDPDAAFANFDRSLERMPAAGELFAILATHAALRALYAEILGSAPRLATQVTTHPHLLDVAIDPTAAVCFDEDEMSSRIEAALVGLLETEDVLDAVRDYQHAEHFLVGVRLLSGQLAPDDAGRAYAVLAVGVVRALLHHVRTRLEAEHGSLPGSSLALVAMGKLGSCEMTAMSDLDLVLVYEFDAAHPETDGRKPIPAPTFFARLVQRLVSALSLPTRRGRLYDVDMRLRPSGRQGPLATKLAAFAVYQREAAQTWEHMALTRARVVAGDGAFSARVMTEILTILRTVPHPRLRDDIADMRALMRRERPAQGDWDLKLLPGGLVDLEFIAQFLALREAPRQPEILATSTRHILQHATASGTLVDGRALIQAHQLLSRLNQMMQLTLPPGHTPSAVSYGLQLRMAEAAALRDFAELTAKLGETLERVRIAFATLFEVRAKQTASEHGDVDKRNAP